MIALAPKQGPSPSLVNNTQQRDYHTSYLLTANVRRPTQRNTSQRLQPIP